MTLRRFTCSLAIALCAISSPLRAAESGNLAPAKQEDLIKILESQAAPGEKAIACKKLAIYGKKEAVPSLAALLPDRELSSWARIALEAIPDPAAAEALRQAVSKTQGRLLVGVINSIGVKADPQAVSVLKDRLEDSDSSVACAAAEALGHIGGGDVATALQAALSGTRADVRSSAAYGCVLTAEKLLADKKASDAVRLYDTIRQANVPKQRALEATRGSILARGTDGIPLLLEQLRSTDAAFLGIGLSAARELPGVEVTQALAAELDKANSERQVQILLALADRNDATVLPKLLQAAESGPKPVRIAAVGMLDRFRDLSSVPVLLGAAADNDAALGKPAKAALARLGGKEVDADLLARLRLASGKMRVVLIDLAKLRRINAALPVVLRSTEDGNADVRRAAVEAVGILGSEAQAGDLVRLYTGATAVNEREDIETALVGLCGRNGTRCLPHVLPLARTGDASSRVVGFHALAAIGGSEALDAIKTALNDADGAIQDEAVRTLSNWPNTWPEDSGVAEPLLALAKSGKKVSHQTQGMQGYLQYVQENKKLSNEEKLDKIQDLLPAVKSADEKRLVIAALSSIPSAASLEKLLSYSQENGVSEEAFQAILRIAGDRNQKGIAVDARRKALQAVAEKSESDATRKKADDAIKRLK